MQEVKDAEKLTRKEKEFLFRRKQILDAAMKLFAEKGYEGTSMQEIASASEFSIGTLYNFFSTKEELYLTLIEDKFKESKGVIESKVAGITGALEKVRAAVEAVLAFMDVNREFFTLFISLQTVCQGKVHGEIHEKVKRYYDMHVEFFRALMEECVRENALKSFEPNELAMALIGITNTWIYNWLNGPGDKPLQAQRERIMELFLNGAALQDKGRLE